MEIPVMFVFLLNTSVLPGQTPNSDDQQHNSALIEGLNLNVCEQSIRPKCY